MSDFCTVAAVAMFTDFNFQVRLRMLSAPKACVTCVFTLVYMCFHTGLHVQVIIYVSVLSLDTRRLELSDFLTTTRQPVRGANFLDLQP